MLGIIYGYDNGGHRWCADLLLEGSRTLTQQTELVVTAIVYGEVIGAIIAGMVTNKIGRKKSMLLLTIGYCVFGLLSALAVDVWTLFGARLGLGLAVGISLIAVPVFVAESVPCSRSWCHSGHVQK